MSKISISIVMVSAYNLFEWVLLQEKQLLRQMFEELILSSVLQG